MARKKEDLLYLYCVTSKEPHLLNLREVGIRISPVYALGLYGITSSVSRNEFSEANFKEKLADVTWLEKKVRLHEKVVERMMQDGAVLPLKFGAVFEKKDRIESMLKKKASAFKRIINELEGKEEWGLKIYCDTEKLKKIIEKEDEAIKRLVRQINSSSTGKAYILDKKREELVKSEVNKIISECTQASFNELKEISSRYKINKLLPKKVTEKEEDMVLNAAFLVDRKKLAEFRKAARLIKTRYVKKALTYNLTGPWPAYNFCEAVTYEVHS